MHYPPSYLKLESSERTVPARPDEVHLVLWANILKIFEKDINLLFEMGHECRLKDWIGLVADAAAYRCCFDAV